MDTWAVYSATAAVNHGHGIIVHAISVARPIADEPLASVM